MSWNAAKRAAALGYTQVDWYSDATDGWAARDLPLELREPVPRPAQ
jgi:rhodanese-related sulfurtransferase